LGPHHLDFKRGNPDLVRDLGDENTLTSGHIRHHDAQSSGTKPNRHATTPVDDFNASTAIETGTVARTSFHATPTDRPPALRKGGQMVYLGDIGMNVTTVLNNSRAIDLEDIHALLAQTHRLLIYL
jgi:hypothetical protein